MSKLLQARHWPGCLSLITPIRGGTEHAYFREGILMPQSPRNFAAEPATWYDLMWSGLSFDPSHDYEFTFTFTLAAAALPTTTDRYLMDYGSPVTAIFGAFYAAGGGISCCCGLFKSSLSGQAETAGEAITLIPNTVGVPLAAGEHSIRMYAVGNSLYAKLDDGDFIYAKSTTRRSDLSILTKAPVTSHNGGVNEITIRDLTDQSVRWSYPSLSERLRLITNTNVLNRGTHWEAANPAVAARIDTQIDLRGKVSDYTVIVDFEAADLANGQMQSLAGQGPGAAGQLSICAVACLRDGMGIYKVQMIHEIAGIRSLLFAPVDQLIGRHVLTGVVSVGTSSTILSLYLDGAFLASQEFAGTPVGSAYASYTNFAIADARNISYASIFGNIYAAALFNKELTAEQIRSFSPVKRWVIPVTAGNINIATVGFQGLRWIFPDGSTSTAASINQTVSAGTVVCEYVGLAVDSRLTINTSTALASSAMRAIDLPRVTNALYLYNLPGLTGTTVYLPRVTNTLHLYNLSGLTGTTADLPRVTYYLNLYNLSGLTGTTVDLPRVTNTLHLHTLPGLTGTTADLPRVTYYLHLYTLSQLTGTIVDLPRVTNYLLLYALPGLTGTTADLPANTGERRCYLVANVTGALSVVATNSPIYFYSTGATALEYDETVHNCVVAGGLSKTLHIGAGTSAGDADIQTLRDRGWSVTIH